VKANGMCLPSFPCYQSRAEVQHERGKLCISRDFMTRYARAKWDMWRKDWK